MAMHNQDALWALTDKEKQTLRLMVRGHDAKSVARSLGLSVHTINERLREARRKMSVSSSREAARMLLEAEDGGSPDFYPQNMGDSQIGEDAASSERDQEDAPVGVPGRLLRPGWIIIGVFAMSVLLSFLALAAMPQATSAPQSAQPAVAPAFDQKVVDAARRWLTLVDAGRWDDSYRETASSFRRLNTARVWADVSEQTRAPLGAATSRIFISQENLPAPPAGYEVVKFRTHFAHKGDAVETVTLDMEDGVWRVVGVMID